MSILSRHLLLQNLFYTCALFFSGMMIYLIVDFAGRINDMMDAGLGMREVLGYFLYKVPLIIAQILPAIFMLAVLIQIALMHRNNELVALESSGVSFRRPAAFFLVYSLAAFALLLVFSETIGVRGEQMTRQIWNEEVRQRQTQPEELRDIWIKEEDLFIHVQRAWPEERKGRGITAYKQDGPGRIQEIIKAQEFEIQSGKWVLSKARLFKPHTLETQEVQALELDVRRDLGSFIMVDSELPYQAWSFFTLAGLVNQLRESGSNVEKISTTLHSKIAYPFALVVMTMLALALFTRIKNIYALVTLGLVIVFFYYTVYVFGVGYAEEGLVSPFLGAWTANLFFGILSLLQIFWVDRG